VNIIFDTVLPIIIFLFGTIIGSFLNVVILRFRSGRSIVKGDSICFSCSKKLCWFELVPIGSFLTQRGRCQGCKTKISWQYPIVEAVTGVLFLALYFHFQYLIQTTPLLFIVLFSYYALIFCILIVLSVYDLKHKILPDKIVLQFVIFAFLGMFLIQGDSIVLHIPSYTQFLAGIVLPAPFSFIWLFSKGRWMGLGDAKFMIGIGFLLGMSAGIVAILFSFWVGAIISVLLLIGSRFFGKGTVSYSSAIPFGPFLALGTIIVILTNYNITSIFQLLSMI
jgi:leader peptidase (prepilin peptidase)/N-methyltransferase